ncbi:hypothetical protein F2Q69_00031198 [Brassica cretica]|uniref:Transposase MuDR plant domain-containing protein n=1 Tax=Brassica cretica TaxID=69181 RepID=A0A8S9S3D4_BRACR|nr:hypothetical protein F2Q69_00031198 [Brassica cretica]
MKGVEVDEAAEDATFEIWAMKHNFDYQVNKSDRQLWYVRCADNACNWAVRVECLKDSTYFIIKKYDIRTTNPAVSINSALRSPREYPVIPLIDSVREMLTRWFYKRKKQISKHKHPLTKDAEKKIDRRTEKGKTFAVYSVTDGRLLVRGDKIDYLVDLDRRTC